MYNNDFNIEYGENKKEGMKILTLLVACCISLPVWLIIYLSLKWLKILG